MVVAPVRRSNGSWAATAYDDLSTTSQPAVAATDWEANPSTTTKAPNRLSPSITRRFFSTQPASVRAPLSANPSSQSHERPGALRARREQPDPHGSRLAVRSERRLQPGCSDDCREDSSPRTRRRPSRDLAPHGGTFAERRRRLDRRP